MEEQVYIVIYRGISIPWRAEGKGVFADRRLAENFIEIAKANGETWEYAIVEGPICNPQADGAGRGRAGEILVSSELIQYEPGLLAITREPTEVLADAHKAAKALMEVVSSKKKQITFNKEVYLESGDWQTVGKFYGVTAKVESTEFVNFGEVRGWKAAAVAIDVTTGREVSRAEAMCLDDEENWGLRPKYEWQDRIVDGKKVWDKELFNGKGGYVRDKVCVSMTPTPLFQLLSMAQTRACSKVLSNLFKWVVVLAGTSRRQPKR